MKKRKNKNTAPDIMHSWIAKFIAVVTVLSFFSYIGAVTFYPLICCGKDMNMEFVNLAIGWIGGVATAVITFYFGSSQSSVDKNELINKAIGKAAAPASISVIREKIDEVKKNDP
jgi:nitrate/nitrite transporter NarK